MEGTLAALFVRNISSNNASHKLVAYPIRYTLLPVAEKHRSMIRAFIEHIGKL
jgi:hypothetical protein